MLDRKIITAVDLKDIRLPPDADVEFHPAFIVREWGVIKTLWWKRAWSWLRWLVTGSKAIPVTMRVITEAELTHISIGFKHTSKKETDGADS